MANTPSIRLDQYLVDKGWAPSKSKAQQLIRSGVVTVKNRAGEKTVEKPGFLVSETSVVTVAASDALTYVSRGGLKLAGALKELSINVEGIRALDIGLSTGGFSDCLLQHGATEVVGVDVGHEQVHARLRPEPRLKIFEGVHVRDMNENATLVPHLEKPFDVITVDLSFISITQVLPLISQWLKPSGHLLALIKPQFELGPEALNKRGVVKDPAQYEHLKEKIIGLCKSLGLVVENYIESPILGKAGNREFFVYAKKI
ncbi:MAG: TlyA family RNA methyltransferase [Pseudobdellovibrionaceae bacterium]|nr:TlyA family RNA methyltransferase [Bdellovibrionales bacterium]USN46671.1 MAG: TlyA family RNA methyltransferase [Pseudobdellovibrionaceae bacterium]